MELKDVLALLISTGALIFTGFSLIRGLVEYRKQGVTKRSELFIQMRTRFREDPIFIFICELLETDDRKLRDVPLIQKDRFTGFFEELALMRNSGLINDQVTLYMFGYYAIRCFDSENFWYGLNRKQALWSLFMDFAQQMKTANSQFKYQREDFHL